MNSAEMNSGKPDITMVTTRLVYENRWMRVREDVIRRQDGSAGVFGVVEKPDFAVVLPVEGSNLHLVEQFRYPAGARYWELPQGSWEEAPGADPLEVARGELLEETGLTAKNISYVGNLYPAYGYATQRYHVFLASELTRAQPTPGLEEQDLITKAFPLVLVEEMILMGDIKDGTTVAALGLARLNGRL